MVSILTGSFSSDTLEEPYCCNKTGGSIEEGECCFSRSQSTYVDHCSHPMVNSTGLPWCK
ncbi:hypothetical protein DPMN_141396 [Dreissena polymorpha]|uniref:Uncharacterized protein n=1 Tax=Dreissena polymorpha TaxID=45954 RepID=A0A9D4GCN7_DREPO|nr:hypothetical protein DPMN_141396 [Dreissena polymorpha]